MAVTMRIIVFWDDMRCGLVGTLKIETVSSSETLVIIYQTISYDI
jgi:hypothetical protein